MSQFRKVLEGMRVRTHAPHSDLWGPIAAMLHSHPRAMLQITKVVSHVHGANSPLEDWTATFNHSVDELAKDANRNRGPFFDALLSRHGAACEHAWVISREIQPTQLRVSRAALKLIDSTKPDKPEHVSCPANAPAPPMWEQLCPLVALPKGAVRWYGDRLVRLVLSCGSGRLSGRQIQDRFHTFNCFLTFR